MEVSIMTTRGNITQEEAARGLLVLVNGQQWRAKSISIVQVENAYWVRTDIMNPNQKGTQEYIVEYSGLVRSWFGLKNDRMLFDHLQVHMNGPLWNVVDLSIFYDDREREWIQIDIEREGETYSVAIERESMIDAFFALKDDIDDLAVIVRAAMTAIAESFL